VQIDELKQQLNAIAWQEQVEAELGERPSIESPADPSVVEVQLRTLAAFVDEAMLDELEREAGYLVWCLRLAPFVDRAAAKQRAQRHVHSTNWHLRHWARRIAALPT
jgi:hypothetical protein